MLLLEIDKKQLNGPMKTKGVEARLKCKIRVANYNYDTKGFLCIQFSCILRLTSLITKT